MWIKIEDVKIGDHLLVSRFSDLRYLVVFGETKFSFKCYQALSPECSHTYNQKTGSWKREYKNENQFNLKKELDKKNIFYLKKQERGIFLVNREN